MKKQCKKLSAKCFTVHLKMIADIVAKAESKAPRGVQIHTGPSLAAPAPWCVIGERHEKFPGPAAASRPGHSITLRVSNWGKQRDPCYHR